MSSKSERGIANILANLATLISFCIGYGIKYNPSNTSLTVQNLQALYKAAQDSLGAVTNAKTAKQTAVKNRKVIFKPLKKLATQILNAFASCGAAKELVDNAKTENNKISGRRANNKAQVQPPKPDTSATTDPEQQKAEDDKTPKRISVSQQSFDQLVEHFAQLVSIVSAEPKYAPNETELAVATLQALVDELKTANQAVIDTNTEISNARLARNSIFKTPETGVTAVTGDVKKYIKSVYGATSPEFKQISGLKFK